MRLLVAISVFVLGVVVYQAYALCNTCAVRTQLACVDVDKFKVCLNGVPSSPPIQCPNGTVCTSGLQVCAPEGTVEGSCAKCRVCNDDSIFACMGYNRFSLCKGTNDPDPKIYTCPAGLVCSMDAKTICVDETTGYAATCPYEDVENSNSTSEEVETTTEILTTTPDPLNDTDAFCVNLNATGRFEISGDPTCTKFVSCTLSSKGVMTGSLYECPNSAFFNGKTQSCGPNRPERCSL